MGFLEKLIKKEKLIISKGSRLEMQAAFRKEIESVQNGTRYDCDSSPKVWEHYKKYYTVDHWKLMSEFDWKAIDTRNNLMGSSYENLYERLFIKSQSSILGNSFLMGGETDFNFNEKKITFFKSILVSGYFGNKGFDNLDICKKNHHTLVNFSLMPATGGLGNYKGSSGQGLDRLDEFVSKLNEFYLYGNKDVLGEVGKSNPINRKYLEKFLRTFDDIYDYCGKVYFIKDRDFVDRIIKEGQQPIVTSKDVVRYMDLALDFWNMKEKYFVEQQK